MEHPGETYIKYLETLPRSEYRNYAIADAKRSLACCEKAERNATGKAYFENRGQAATTADCTCWAGSVDANCPIHGGKS